MQILMYYTKNRAAEQEICQISRYFQLENQHKNVVFCVEMWAVMKNMGETSFSWNEMTQ